MKERNYNIDVLRAMAILLIVLYHSWVQCGSVQFSWSVLNYLIPLGGEIGVTAFFALSGYGIFCSLQKKELSESGLSFFSFMKKRFQRVLPQYLMCILVYFTLMGGDAFNWAGVKNIAAHLLFIHNFFPDFHGAINGVFWTMGVIIQFYIVAIPLYLGLKKWRGKFAIACLGFTVIMKIVVYHFFLSDYSGVQTYYFIYGRQLYTALDNFVVGMWVAQHLTGERKTLPLRRTLSGVLLGFVMLLLVCYEGTAKGIWADSLLGYTWHSLLVLALVLIAVSFAQIGIDKNNFCVRIFLWISKYEYGIYVWHLLIINSILSVSPWIWEQINAGRHWMIYAIFMAISILVGYVMSIAFDKIKIFAGK